MDLKFLVPTIDYLMPFLWLMAATLSLGIATFAVVMIRHKCHLPPEGGSIWPERDWE